MANKQTIKDIGSRYADQIVAEGRGAGLSAYEICQVCEVVTAMVVSAEAERNEITDKLTWADNLLITIGNKMQRKANSNRRRRREEALKRYAKPVK